MTTSAIKHALSGAWSYLPNPVKSAVKKTANAALKTSAVAASYFVPGMIPYLGIIQAPAAAYAAYKVFNGDRVSLYSGRVVVGNRSLPFTGNNRDLPEDPKKPLVDLVGKVYEFKTRQPAGQLWKPEVVEGSLNPAPIAPVSAAELNLEQPPTDALGANPQSEQKDWRNEADHNLKQLALNASNFSTLYFLHVNRLGKTIDENLLMQITQEASKPDTSLWSIYMKHLGKELGFFDKIVAGWWYFWGHTTGVIGNSIETFLKNILHEFRSQLNDKDRESHLDTLFKKIIGRTSSFLDIYNGAMRSYAMAEQPVGDAKDYRKEAISNLYGKNLRTLSIEFSDIAVDEFFPKVPFFENLKKSAWTSWLYAPIDFLFGNFFTWIGKKIVKKMLPDVVQKVVEKGVEATEATNLPFSIAITKTLTELFIDLGGTSPENQPIEALPGMQDLPIAIDKLLVTLELIGPDEELAANDTQPVLRKKFKEIDNPDSTALKYIYEHAYHKYLRDEIRTGIIRATQVFLLRFVEKPQAVEKLFADLFRLFNVAFETGAPRDQNGVLLPANEVLRNRRNDYAQANEGLQNAASNFFDKIVRAGVAEFVRGVPNTLELLTKAHDAQKTDATESFRQLNKVAAEISQKAAPQRGGEPLSILSDLDHAAEILKNFANNFQSLKIQNLPKAAQTGFYGSFYPIYQQSEDLVTKLLEMQDLQVKYTHHHQLAQEFNQIQLRLEELSRQINQRVYQSSTLVEELKKQKERIRSYLPQDAQEPVLLLRQIETLEQNLAAANAEEAVLLQLERLGGRQGLLFQLAETMQNRPPAGFNIKLCNQELTEALSALKPNEQAILKPLIHQLQNFKRTKPRPDILDLWQKIQEALTQIADPHETALENHLTKLQRSLQPFRGWAESTSDAYAAKKEENNLALRDLSLQWRTQAAHTARAIERSTVETQHHPLQYIPEAGINSFADSIGLKTMIMNKFRSAYKLLTSSDIYDATTRIIMHEVVDSY